MSMSMSELQLPYLMKLRVIPITFPFVGRSYPSAGDTANVFYASSTER